MFKLPIFLLLPPITTEIATAILSMAGHRQGLHRRSKQNLHQPMIPYFPFSKSYSPTDLPYGTPSNDWNITQSLVNKPCAIQPWSVWYHKTWMYVLLVLPALGFQSFVIIIDNTKVTLNVIKITEKNSFFWITSPHPDAFNRPYVKMTCPHWNFTWAGVNVVDWMVY